MLMYKHRPGFEAYIYMQHSYLLEIEHAKKKDTMEQPNHTEILNIQD